MRITEEVRNREDAVANTRGPSRTALRALPKNDPPMSILLIENHAHILSIFAIAPHDYALAGLLRNRRAPHR